MEKKFYFKIDEKYAEKYLHTTDIKISFHSDFNGMRMYTFNGKGNDGKVMVITTDFYEGYCEGEKQMDNLCEKTAPKFEKFKENNHTIRVVHCSKDFNKEHFA